MKRLLIPLLAVVALQVGCRETRPRPDAPHPRIVSYSPAITDMLFDMGLGDHVVGVTTYCKLPDRQRRRRVGSQLDFTTEAVLAVEPDIVLTQSDASRFRGVVSADPRIRIEQLKIESLDDISTAMRRIGELAGKAHLAAKAQQAFDQKLARIAESARGRGRPRVLFVMGTDRPSVAAEGSFVHDLLVRCGAVNAGDAIPGQPRWREVTIEAIHKAAPDVIICQMLRAERAESARKYWLRWTDLPAVKARRVFVVTDPHWTIPSARVADLGLKLVQMLHGPPPAREDK